MHSMLNAKGGDLVDVICVVRFKIQIGAQQKIADLNERQISFLYTSC